VTINGFAVLNDKALRNKWRQVRKKFIGKRRIHAVDSIFEPLRKKSIELIGRHDLSILSVFQIIQEIPSSYFKKDNLDFEKLYLNLTKILLSKLSLNEYIKVNIVIDSRKKKGGKIGSLEFKKELKSFLENNFRKTQFSVNTPPSSSDILIELADFISNTFYRAYQNEKEDIFSKLKFKLIQIKNPL